MPLYVGGNCLSEVPAKVEELVSKLSLLQESNSALLSENDVQLFEGAVEDGKTGDLSTSGVLHVYQREFAVLTPNVDNIEILGTTDATTCHVLIVRHTGSGVTGLAHLDGTAVREGINRMLTKCISLSQCGPDGRWVVHLIGGFLDARQLSRNLSFKVLDCLINFEAADLHLVTACICGCNDIVRNGIHYPAVYGTGVEVRSGRVFKAKFLTQGPDAGIRSAGNFTCVHELREVFQVETNELIIGPFDWSEVQCRKELIPFIDEPDHIILKYLSTSPQQEQDTFADHVREALTVLKHHPTPLRTLFIGGCARKYVKTSNHKWNRTA